jgi:hypothetical protein
MNLTNLQSVNDFSYHNLDIKRRMSASRKSFNNPMHEEEINSFDSKMIEKYEFDVFISFRRESDYSHAELIVTLLREVGLKVWWTDCYSDEGHASDDEVVSSYSAGIKKCSIFLAIISQGAINDKDDWDHNFFTLQSNSKKDQLLFEYLVALELQQRGIIKAIYPVLIGNVKQYEDRDSTDGGIVSVYGNYFKDHCHPEVRDDVTVSSVVGATETYLDMNGFGTALLVDCSVQTTLCSLLENTGCEVEGPVDEGPFDRVIDDIILIKSQINSLRSKLFFSKLSSKIESKYFHNTTHIAMFALK